MIQDNDVNRVLKNDGVERVDLTSFVNPVTISFNQIKNRMGTGSWAVRVFYNRDFGGVIIKQLPDEGNRLHHHPDADECWVILEGILEWEIVGEGNKIVKEGDIVVVKANTKHRITNIGTGPAIRLAITKPDVGHVYSEEERK